jgi:hypothetical protein
MMQTGNAGSRPSLNGTGISLIPAPLDRRCEGEERDTPVKPGVLILPPSVSTPIPVPEIHVRPASILHHGW